MRIDEGSILQLDVVKAIQENKRALRFARHWVAKYLLPTFRRIPEDAEKHATAELARLRESTSELEYEIRQTFIDEMARFQEKQFKADAYKFKQAFINLLFVQLYHLFEQQLAHCIHLKREIASPDDMNGTGLWQAFFDAFGLDITSFQSWPRVDELRLIANVVKHVDARDAEKLRKKNPLLFAAEDRKNEGSPPSYPSHSSVVNRALMGEDLFLKPEFYHQKVGDLLAFWGEFEAIYMDFRARPKTIRERIVSQRQRILDIATKHGASNVRLFGSVARGEAGPASDIDLLVDFRPGTSFGQEQALACELEGLLGRKVDVGSESALKPRMRERVLRDAVPL